MRKYFSQTLKIGSSMIKSNSIHNMVRVQPVMITYRPTYNFSVDMRNHENVSRSSYEGPQFYVEQMLTGCLALYSYYIESGNEVIIIDPQNDITKYVEILETRNKKLKAVFLSHYHADYIAGHYELQKKYGCHIYMGPKAVELKGFTILKDQQKIKIGYLDFELIHTPGHTE